MSNAFPPVFSYGADANGVICAYGFNHNSRQELDTHTLNEALQNPDTYKYVWVHVNLSHNHTEKWLKDTLKVHPAFFEALHDGVQSTRIEIDDNTLIAVINDVLFDFNFDSTQIATLWVYVTPKLILTARVKPLRSIDHLRLSIKRGDIPDSTIHLLVHLLQDQEDVLLNILHKITERTNLIEDSILSNERTVKREQLAAMRRLLVKLQRLLAPEPAAMFRLLNRPLNWMSSSDITELRHATEEFATVIRDSQELVERIKLLQEEMAAQMNEEINRSLYVLTIVSVLALPINIIAGLFGMNVGGIPLNTSEHGFAIIVLVIICFTIIAGYWVSKKQKDEL